jgi:(2R)-sulfolactate sulfo-lyase subunit alpha
MIHFVVHEEGLVGWIMEDDKEIKMIARSDIPIGHKLALKDFKPGDTVIKYGVDIGKIVAPIARGEHTHVQNLKTKRW